MTGADIEKYLDLACDDVGEAVECLIRLRALQIQHVTTDLLTPRDSAQAALYLTAGKLRGLAMLLEERARKLDEHHRPESCRQPPSTYH